MKTDQELFDDYIKKCKIERVLWQTLRAFEAAVEAEDGIDSAALHSVREKLDYEHECALDRKSIAAFRARHVKVGGLDG